MFTPEERERVFERLLEHAQTDSRIIGAATVGSAAQDQQDRWSDIDLLLGVSPGTSPDIPMFEWTEWIHREFDAIHHFDVRSGPTVYRLFVLPTALELDIAFAPAADFGARGTQFRALFGTPSEATLPSLPDIETLIGSGWHHVIHARACIERGKMWQAEYWISALRDHTLTLACLRFRQRTSYAKGVHGLPRDVTAPLEDALVRSLESSEMWRALEIATGGFLREVQEAKPDVVDDLRRLLAEVIRPPWLEP